MLDDDRPEQAVDDGEFVDVDEPACVALVPVTQPSRLVAGDQAPRPDPTFVAQLIATADQAPQTRGLRRASPADAQTAYGASQQPAPRRRHPDAANHLDQR